MSQPQQPSVAAPSLPKGGGAIQSIGKGLGPGGPTGAASYRIDLPISPGRGYAPELALTYQSTVGNGPFGLGWNVPAASVGRRSSKGVPHYTDDDVMVGPDGDVWMPELDEQGQRVTTSVSQYRGLELGATYQVCRHFARTEGAFARIEHWRRGIDDQGFWLVHSADGQLHLFGHSVNARIADPDDRSHVAQWLLEESLEPLGQHILYNYDADDLAGLPPDHPRDFRAQRYLARVMYGNDQALMCPYRLYGNLEVNWHFHLVFDYGQRSDAPDVLPGYGFAHPWPVRSDPHSSFAYGFELGTLRLCRQALMFHKFPELGNEPVLVQRLLLQYRQDPLSYSLLQAAHLQGIGEQDEITTLPPVSFDYSEFAAQASTTREFQPMPGLDDGVHYQLVDLYGEGLPGILLRQDKGWYYREPLRDTSTQAPDAVVYGPRRLLPQIPLADSGSPARQALTDVTGDGQLDWLVAQPGLQGYFSLNPDREWSRFVALKALPSEFFHPDIQLADLVGAGLADLALIGPRSVRLYINQREQGFSSARQVTHDEDPLPLTGSSPSELVVFADILGSGQQHLIRIRHNELRCWPNLGHGRFGRGFRFCELPFSPSGFDANRVRLADLDGSGAVDLLYLQSDHLSVFMNLAGMGLEQQPRQFAWPTGVRYDQLCQVSLADLQGLGCTSLILSQPHAPGVGQSLYPRHWRLDFIQRKPYLMCRSDNHMGAVSTLQYRGSAQEWLDEKQEQLALGVKPACRLPLSLHLVTRQQQLDEVTGNCLSQLMRYRQGYYDGQEREFRGFGLVLQQDAERPSTDAQTREEQALYTAPVLTRTWYHTGRYPFPPLTGIDQSDTGARPMGTDLLSHFDAQTQRDEIVTDLTETQGRDMARTLSGAVIRVEVFGLDDDPANAVPYSIQQQRYLVRELLPRTPQRPYASMLALDLESLAYQYERQANDPRCQHQVNLAWDAYGSLTHGVQLAYARRLRENDTPPFEDEHQQTWWRDAHDEQQQVHYLSEQRAAAIHLDHPQSWRLGLPWRTRQNALVIPAAQLPPANIDYEHLRQEDGPLRPEVERQLTGLHVQRYQQASDGEATFEALPDYLQSAELDELALQVYERVLNRADLEARLLDAGYARMPAFLPEEPARELWSVNQGYSRFAEPKHFYRLDAFRQTLSHGWTVLEYDPYHLQLTTLTLPDGCTTRAIHDYRGLQPVHIVDANENVQQARYDGLGRLLATSFWGTELGEPTGFNDLDSYERPFDSPGEAIEDSAAAAQGIASAYFYDAFSWMQDVDRRQPVHSVAVQADRYPGDPECQYRVGIASLDGFGRALQSKQRVDPGPAYAVDEQGELVLESGQPVTVEATDRWRVSERVEYNNKGLAVRSYRPYFADQWRHINDVSFRQFGYNDRQFYDPLGRPTVTLTAKGFMRRETYWPWYTISEDENDTYEEAMAARTQP